LNRQAHLAWTVDDDPPRTNHIHHDHELLDDDVGDDEQA